MLCSSLGFMLDPVLFNIFIKSLQEGINKILMKLQRLERIFANSDQDRSNHWEISYTVVITKSKAQSDVPVSYYRFSLNWMHSCRGSTGLNGMEDTGLMHKAKIIHEAEEIMAHKVVPLEKAVYIFPMQKH